MKDAASRFIEAHGLSGRQAQVLRGLVDSPAKSAADLGKDLGLAEATVNVHFSKIFLKVKCRNKVELLAAFQKFQQEAQSQVQASASLRVMLVEDDRGFREQLLAALRAQGKVAVEPIALEDGREAIEHLSRAKQDDPSFLRPDIILLDLMMPRLDGYGLLTKIKRDPLLKQIPCVVFSSEMQQESVNRAYELGASSYLRKPHNDIELKVIVETLLTIWGQYGRAPQAIA